MNMPTTQPDAQRVYAAVFHDWSPSPLKVLKDLFRISRTSRTVSAILESCTRAIRVEYTLLDREDRLRITVVRTLNELVRKYEKGIATDPVTTNLLHFVAQFGCFAILAEREPWILSADRDGIHHVGLCAGVIAATGACAARSQTDLHCLAEPLTRVAFRFALEADRRGRVIDPSPESWAFVPFGLTESAAAEVLEDFHRSESIPNHRRAYISAELPSSVTISGPPSTLRLLRSSVPRLSASKSTSLPITTAFHAEHLDCPDLEYVVEPIQSDTFRLRANVGIISTSDHGRIDFEGHDLRTVLKSSLRECYQSKMILSTSATSVAIDRNPKVDVMVSVGPAGSASSLQKWLAPEGNVEYKVAGVDQVNVTSKASRLDDIAIVGMAGRFPNADTLDEFWDVIASGKDVHQEIPESRFNVAASYDKTTQGRNTTASPYGCFMKRPEGFDHVFFNISPREAKQIDPQQRLLLMVTQEALQMAGYSTAGNKRIGTFFGQTTDDWRESHMRQDIDIFYVGGGIRAFGPGRLNYHFKWDGPSYSVDTACSSSLAALELAYKSVQSGDCDLAVAGGGNLCSALPLFSGLSKGKFTSSTGSCKTFCQTADGYCRGEAVGVVVIQRVADAIAENNNIKGIVASIATNHSAFATSITHPHAGAQETLMLRCLSDAGMEQSELDYVEFHGTGTQAGDMAEMTSVSSVCDQGDSRSTPLYVGSVKSNVGHGEAAAGITSLIKALLMIKHDTIPPHCGIKTALNSKLKTVMSKQLKIPSQAIRFPQRDGPRSILINNFNATGGNTCMILRESAENAQTRVLTSRSQLPITISAQTSSALTGNLARLRDYLVASPEISLQDISYSTTARRTHYRFRHAIVASDVSQLAEVLQQRVNETPSAPVSPRPRIAFAFAGQGTQKQGIAAELLRTSPTFRSILQKFESICIGLGYDPFMTFLVDAAADTKWSAVQLQLATVAVELALTRLMQEWGLEPSFVIGHSIGEYAALCVAGVLSTSDMFSLVGKRAQLMETLCQAGTHGMLSVKSSQERIEELLSTKEFAECEVSCYNSRQAITVSGPNDLLVNLQACLKGRKIQSKVLKVQYAFHSSNIEPILKEYRDFAASIPFSAPQIPVISTLLGKKVVTADVFGAQYLVDQARQPVNYIGALENFSSGLNSEELSWIEVGPGDPSCLPLIMGSLPSQYRKVTLPILSTRNPVWDNLSKVVAICYESGLDINWMSFHKDYESSLTLLDMPTYAFELQDFWIPLNAEVSSQASVKKAEKISPLLHNLSRFSKDKDVAIAEFQSNLGDPYMFSTIQGHFVMEVPLCPSSVYSAIAMEAASYLQSKISPGQSAHRVRELKGMDITRPLVVSEGTGLQLSVSSSKKSNSDLVTVSFVTSEHGSPAVGHGKCSIVDADINVWKSEWDRVQFLVSARIEHMENTRSSSILRLPKQILYRLFSHIVNYAEPFRGIQHITLDNKNNEAIAEVQFDCSPESDAEYDVHLIDSLMHFAGFVLNNGIEDDGYGFISDGWTSLRVPPRLSRTDSYKLYVRLTADKMQQTFSGDVYAFSNEQIVACCNGVRFKKMKKQTLQNILGSPVSQGSKSGSGKSSNQQSNVKQSSKQLSVDNSILREQHHANPADLLKRIVAEESGISEDKVLDSANVQELGLDSILMLSVLDKIKQRIGTEIPSHEAAGALTFGDLQAIVLASAEDDPAQETTAPHQSQKSIPRRASTDVEGNLNMPASDGSELLEILVSTIADQVGVTVEQVVQTDDFSTLGVDSLLSLAIADSVQQQTEEELPALLLQENPSIEKLRRVLNKQGSSPTSQDDLTSASGPGTPVSGKGIDSGYASPSSISHKLRSLSTQSTIFDQQEHTPRDDVEFSCEVRLVQGNPRSTANPLFVIPPGDGTAAVYSKFPKNPDNVPIYAPESPWADNPDHEQNTFSNVAKAYQTAIRKAFPEGPYHVAGYSVGGAYAYEVVRLLLEEGCAVASLIIIDCPAPASPVGDSLDLSLDAMTMVGFTDHLYDTWPSIPDTRMKHTAAAMQNYNQYEPKPFGQQRPEHTTVLWATHGNHDHLISRCVVEQQLLNDTPVEKRRLLVEKRRKEADVSWLFAEGDDFGPRGWDRWLGSEVEYQKVDGTHLSVVFGSTLNDTAAKVYRALKQGNDMHASTKA